MIEEVKPQIALKEEPTLLQNKTTNNLITKETSSLQTVSVDNVTVERPKRNRQAPKSNDFFYFSTHSVSRQANINKIPNNKLNVTPTSTKKCLEDEKFSIKQRKRRISKSKKNFKCL